MIVRTEGLTKRFGGLTAVDGVDLQLERDECCSVIGPNGAGKTTLFDLLTGELVPSSGTIEFRTDGGWTDITGAPPHRTAGLGLHRSNQITNVFEASTVRENVRIAAQAAGSDALNCWRNATAFEAYTEEAEAIVSRVGLTEHAEKPASTLSHGAKRKLEIAIALAGDPETCCCSMSRMPGCPPTRWATLWRSSRT